MSFLVAIFQLGWQILRALLWMPATVLFGALLCLIAYWANRREEAMQPKQEEVSVEPSGLEAFDAEYYELYQTGLWLLLHNAEAPYDDL